MNDSEEPIRFTPFTGFAEIARRNYAAMNELLTRLPAEPALGDDDGRTHTQWWHDTEADRNMLGEHAAVTVIMSAFAIELYVNDCAARLLGQRYYESHFDKPGTLSKCILLPRLICAYQIDLGGECSQRIGRLFQVRNELVHPKTRKIEDVEKYFSRKQKRDIPGAPEYLQEAARNAIAALDALFAECKNWDEVSHGRTHLLGEQSPGGEP